MHKHNAGVTLKIRSRSSEANQLSSPPTYVSIQVWSKSIHWFRRYCAEMADFTVFIGWCLKIRSMSPKSNQLFIV